MRKKGLSAIVATILIILIVIAAIAIFWAAILPLLQKTSEISPDNTKVAIIIAKGYTVYDEQKQFAFVQVKRGVDDENVGRLNFLFNVEGNSVVYETPDAPGVNGEKIYSFNFSRDGIEGIPEFVSVAPVFVEGNQEVLGDITSRVKMPIKPAEVTPEDDEESEDNRVKNTNEPLRISTCLSNPMESNRLYILQNDVVASDATPCFNFTDVVKTKLDLNGFKITGSPVNYAIYIRNSSNLEIENGEIVGAYTAIHMVGSVRNTISGLDISASKYKGLYMDSSSDYNSVLSCSFSDGQGTTYIYGADIRGNYNSFKDITSNNNLATDNVGYSRGISVYLGGHNAFENIETRKNYATGTAGRSYGFYLINTSYNSFTNLWTSDNYNTGNDGSTTGLYLSACNFSSFAKVNSSNNKCMNNCDLFTPDGGSSAVGIGVSNCGGDMFNDLKVADNFHTGLYLYAGTNNNSFTLADLSSNDNYGLSVQNAWSNNFTNILANDMERGLFMVNYQDSGVNNNNQFVNFTAYNNNYGIFFYLISTTNKVMNMRMTDSHICASTTNAIMCGSSGGGTSGSGNFIGSNNVVCSDNSWPAAGTYTSC
jgi:parallel beta-helix repeat protein